MLATVPLSTHSLLNSGGSEKQITAIEQIAPQHKKIENDGFKSIKLKLEVSKKRAVATEQSKEESKKAEKNYSQKVVEPKKDIGDIFRDIVDLLNLIVLTSFIWVPAYAILWVLGSYIAEKISDVRLSVGAWFERRRTAPFVWIDKNIEKLTSESHFEKIAGTVTNKKPYSDYCVGALLDFLVLARNEKNMEIRKMAEDALVNLLSKKRSLLKRERRFSVLYRDDLQWYELLADLSLSEDPFRFVKNYNSYIKSVFLLSYFVYYHDYDGKHCPPRLESAIGVMKTLPLDYMKILVGRFWESEYPMYACHIPDTYNIYACLKSLPRESWEELFDAIYLRVRKYNSDCMCVGGANVESHILKIKNNRLTHEELLIEVRSIRDEMGRASRIPSHILYPSPPPHNSSSNF